MLVGKTATDESHGDFRSSDGQEIIVIEYKFPSSPCICSEKRYCWSACSMVSDSDTSEHSSLPQCISLVGDSEI